MRFVVSLLSLVLALLALAGCSQQSPNPVTPTTLIDPHMPKSISKRDIRVIHFSDRPVSFEAANGLAYFEGDIVLGTIEELENLAGQGLSTQALGLKSGTVLHAWRWESRVVPYTISSQFSAGAQQFILDAIKHWQDKTAIHFVPRTTEQDYLNFIPSGGCASYVGKIGGAQNIWLAEGCGFGATVHEIGHAMGYWHEQSRCDRDRFVKVNYENIQSGLEYNFDKNCTDGTMIGAYDYDSIMHYPKWGFARDFWGCYNGNASKCPIVPLNGVDPNRIGQSNGLSPKDINGMTNRYRSTFPCTSSSCKYRIGLISSGLTRTFPAATSSTLEAWLEGAPGTSFNLFLQHYNGTRWVNVASSVNAASKEHILATNLPAGSYRWRIVSTSGSPNGSFDFWTLPN